MKVTPVFTSSPGFGQGDMLVAPNVDNDGKPRVLLVIKKSVLNDAVLDGEPAWVVGLNEVEGKNNAAWELAHQLTHHWDEAVKQAGDK